MKRLLSLAILLSLLTTSSFAQEEGKDNRPVKLPWTNIILVDAQTTKNIPQGGIEFQIHHRFGKMNNGLTDLYGIYAPSNIRLGFNYGITNKLSVGFGSEKNNKLQEFQLKYTILQQTNSNSVPVDVAYFGNFVIDARADESFGEQYAFTNRFSFFNSIIVSRKFNNRISLQVAGNYHHFNSVDSLTRHDMLSFHVGGRVKVYGTHSLIFEYNQPLDMNLNSQSTYDQFNEISKPGFSIGYEKGTGTHAFEIFLSNYENIVAQKNIHFNKNDFFAGEFVAGFNITVRF